MGGTQGMWIVVVAAALAACPPDQPDTAVGEGFATAAGGSSPGAPQEDAAVGTDDGAVDTSDAAVDGASSPDGALQLDAGASGATVQGGNPFIYDAAVVTLPNFDAGSAL